MKKIRKLLRLLLPYLLILLILAAGLCGSFFLIRNAKIYDASIVRHDAPDSPLLKNPRRYPKPPTLHHRRKLWG